MRVDEYGVLSETPHPFPVDGIIDRDFCESQIELITPPCDSVEEAYASLRGSHEYVSAVLKGRAGGPEYLWLYSNPPYVDGNHIPTAEFPEELVWKNEYREYLAGKYGKRMMLYSGIHFNASFSQSFLARARELSAPRLSAREFCNQFYLNLSAQVLRYSWLPVFLTAASPVFDLSLRYRSIRGIDGFQNIASMRNSQYGYWNHFTPVLDHTSIDMYLRSIQRYVDSGILYSPAELYLPVRIKPKGENQMKNFYTEGVSHIELRMIDLNPLAKAGVQLEDLEFLQYLLIYLTSLRTEIFPEERQIEAVDNHKAASGYDAEHIYISVDGNHIPILHAAERILQKMFQFYQNTGSRKGMQVVSYQLRKVQNPQKRYAVEIYERYRRHYVEKMLQDVKRENKVKEAV